MRLCELTTGINRVERPVLGGVCSDVVIKECFIVSNLTRWIILFCLFVLIRVTWEDQYHFHIYKRKIMGVYVTTGCWLQFHIGWRDMRVVWISHLTLCSTVNKCISLNLKLFLTQWIWQMMILYHIYATTKPKLQNKTLPQNSSAHWSLIKIMFCITSDIIILPTRIL